MIIDTSAIMSVVLAEDGSDDVLDALLNADHLKMSTPTFVELSAVLVSRPPEIALTVERFLDSLDVEIVAFDAEMSKIAVRAYRDFGKGSGHKARLNLGDCFSYALASASGESLLYVGDDFSHTDIG